MAIFIPKWLIGVLAAAIVVVVSVVAFVAGSGLNAGTVSIPPIPTDAAVSPSLAPASPSTSAPTATTPSTAVPTPTRTTAPTATATVAPTRTPTITTFPRADEGSASTSGKHRGLFGIVYADAAAAVGPPSRRIQVAAWVPTVGVRETPSARAFVYNTFRAPSGTGSVQAQISGTIRWKGTLAGNGVLGTGASIRVDVYVMEGDRLVATENVYSREIRDSKLTIGGIEDADSDGFSLTATLTPGVSYRLYVEAKCSAFTGVAAAVVHCIYAPSDLYADGYIESLGVAIRF